MPYTYGIILRLKFAAAFPLESILEQLWIPVTFRLNAILLVLATSALLLTRWLQLGGYCCAISNPHEVFRGTFAKHLSSTSQAHCEKTETLPAIKTAKQQAQTPAFYVGPRNPHARVPGMRVSPGVRDLVRRALDSPKHLARLDHSARKQPTKRVNKCSTQTSNSQNSMTQSTVRSQPRWIHCARVELQSKFVVFILAAHSCNNVRQACEANKFARRKIILLCFP